MAKNLSKQFDKAYELLNKKIDPRKVRVEMDKLRKDVPKNELQFFDDLYDTVIE
tara:strand:+ start:963 stop:1124 length:162 start_codon:yes stop_codon:yes gene_type:complete